MKHIIKILFALPTLTSSILVSSNLHLNTSSVIKSSYVSLSDEDEITSLKIKITATQNYNFELTDLNSSMTISELKEMIYSKDIDIENNKFPYKPESQRWVYYNQIIDEKFVVMENDKSLSWYQDEKYGLKNDDAISVFISGGQGVNDKWIQWVLFGLVCFSIICIATIVIMKHPKFNNRAKKEN